MLELRADGDGFTSSFAGDVINFGIYLYRQCPSASIKFFSAIGEDAISQQLLQFLDQENIDTELVFRSSNKTIGLYMVHTDNLGERTFSYWRSDSAARQMFYLVDMTLLEQTANLASHFYFSGITLAILDQDSRNQLFALVEKMHANGKTIVFDPNYRASLWGSHEKAQKEIRRAYQLSHMLLTSQDDEQALFGTTTIKESIDHIASFNAEEIIISNGANTIHGLCFGKKIQVEPAQPENIVDTTSAGDAFNAGYLAARYAGNSPINAIKKASSLAASVIGFPGAIMPVQ